MSELRSFGDIWRDPKQLFRQYHHSIISASGPRGRQKRGKKVLRVARETEEGGGKTRKGRVEETVRERKVLRGVEGMSRQTITITP